MATRSVRKGPRGPNGRGSDRNARAAKGSTIRDIHPRTPVASLDGSALSTADLSVRFDINLVAALVGMSPWFVKKVLGSDTTRLIRLDQVLRLLDQDAFSETFVPRSRIPAYLLEGARNNPAARTLALRTDHQLIQGNAIDLLPRIAPASVACVVTSTPYWGMRIYDEHFVHTWADGERCALGNEQTPDGFVRHSTEILFNLKPALTPDGSVWWNLMDSYNTRTQIRSNASETLNAMRGNDSRGWHDHACRRYSAGHAYLKDGEQCLIPSAVAGRASRLGYFVKSVVSWKKTGSLPETVDTRVSREVEYILHLAVHRSPFFEKKVFLTLPESLGGRNRRYESEKVTDVWHLSTASGLDGHGAQFPVALPARCIALSTRENDVVLDPFVGSGTTSVAAALLGRRSLGFDIGAGYLETAKRRLDEARSKAPLTTTSVAAGPVLVRQASLL